MQINYTAVGGTDLYTTLVDTNAGGVCTDWKPKALISVQRDPLAVLPGAANSAFRQPMGNVTQTLPLVIQLFYASPSAALLAIANLTIALLTVKNHLQVIESAGGSQTIFYPNAVCTSIDADQTGATVQYRMTFETDLVTTADPA